MPEPLILTEYDVQDHKLLLRHLRQVGERILRLDGRVSQVEQRPPSITTREISRELRALGQAPLRVDNLQGVLANPQPAKAPVYSSEPTGQILQNLYDGQLIVVGTTSTGDKLYRVVGGNPNTLRPLNPNLSGVTVSVADADFTIYDDADNTKTLKFEASVIATGTTRVMTIPNESQILAGRNVNNSFSTDETMAVSKDASLLFLVNNSNSTGVSAAAELQSLASTAKTHMISWGAANTNTILGVTVGNYSGFINSAGNGILFGTSNNTPLVMGTNNAERARFDTAGLLTFKTAAKCILIKPVSAPAANTIMTEVQTSTGGSIWSVDAEGDEIARSTKLTGIAADTFLIQPASASGGAELFRIKDTGGTEAVSMRDDGYTRLIGGSAGMSIDNSGISGTLVFEAKQSGSQTSSLTNDGAFQCDLSVDAGTTVTAGTSVVANASNGFKMGSVFWRTGAGTPEGAITAPIGSLWTRTDGGAVTTLYVKESGSGNTGWVAK